MGTQSLHLVYNFAQPRLVGGRRCGASAVEGGCLGRHAFADIVVVDFVAVHARNLLVVVGKLYQHIVASLDFWFGRLPQFIVAAPGVTPAFGIVNRGPTVRQEHSEIHPPPSGDGG